MKTSDDLFLLIKSLSKSQKRYFKLSSSIHAGDKVYLKLFSAIDRQKKYDEPAIKKIFHEEPFIRQLTRAKYYLYELILKNIRAYRKNSINKQIRELIDDAEFLFEARLYKQCEKIIEKAKAIAVKQESFLSLVELLNWELKMAKALSYSGKTEKQMESLFQKISDSIDRYKNFTEYKLLITRMRMRLYKKGYTRKSADSNYYKNIIHHPLLRSDKKALSQQALNYFYSCNATCSFMNNDYRNAYRYTKQLLEIKEKNPEEISSNPQLYLSTLRNLYTAQLHLKKYDGLPEIIDKLNMLRESQIKKEDIFYSSIFSVLELYTQIGEFKKALLLINKYETEIEDVMERKIDKQTKILLCYSLVWTYFGLADYSKANRWLNKIVNDGSKDIRSDIYCFAKIWSLIIYFELDKQDLLEYAVKSTYRFLLKRDRLYMFESVVLNFIRKKMSKIISQQEQILSFKKLKKEIEKVTKDPFEYKALEYFDFISWLESKIEKCSFAQIVREKAMGQSMLIKV